MSTDGQTTNMLTPKDPDSFDLIDNSAAFTSQFISAKVEKCNVLTSQVECASLEDIRKYLSSHTLGIVTAINFIDYREVDPYKGPLKNAAQWVELRRIDYMPEYYNMRRISLREHQI